MRKDHMESENDVERTRCGLTVNRVQGWVFEYGSKKTTCEGCKRMYERDITGGVNNG